MTYANDLVLTARIADILKNVFEKLEKSSDGKGFIKQK